MTVAKPQTSDSKLKERPNGIERRDDDERRQQQPATVHVERRKVQRRRQIDPTTCERDYTNDEIEFMQALDAYKRQMRNNFPTTLEILNVLVDLGYTKELKAEAALGS